MEPVTPEEGRHFDAQIKVEAPGLYGATCV